MDNELEEVFEELSQLLFDASEILKDRIRSLQELLWVKDVIGNTSQLIDSVVEYELDDLFYEEEG
jgi:hypothetical protein